MVQRTKIFVAKSTHNITKVQRTETILQKQSFGALHL
jgi:hypothetical protein